jgi:hypothetical protein
MPALRAASPVERYSSTDRKDGEFIWYSVDVKALIRPRHEFSGGFARFAIRQKTSSFNDSAIVP